jgi:hypothetical protein
MACPCAGLLLFVIVIGCGDDSGGDSGGGGGTGEADTGGEGEAEGGEGADDESGEPPENEPDEDGDRCGTDIHGWQTRCMVEDVTASTSDQGSIPGAPAIGAHTGRTLCCEGNPPVATADAGCDAICRLEVCEAARLHHMSRCDACGPFDCGFDMSKCLGGGTHLQTVVCAEPLQWPVWYDLTASCSAFNNELRNPDGSFDFLEQPDNVVGNDPPTCEPADDLGYDPPRGLGQYKGSASDGTVARVTWSMADAGGEEQTEELYVRFEYAIVPCAAVSNACLQLTALEVTLPTTQVLGMTITNARLAVISVAEAPVMERGDHFHFSDGSMRVSVQAHVDGIPLALSGWNTGQPRGRLSPAGDQLSLDDLRFEFEDSMITAALEIGIQGHYDARRPNAQITHVTAPESCAEPVTLLATSWDDDGDALVHEWWIEGVGVLSGALVEVVLPAGEHDVRLTSFDPSGLFDHDTLRYVRMCQ